MGLPVTFAVNINIRIIFLKSIKDEQRKEGNYQEQLSGREAQ
jgi:hypothetical protein